MRKTTIICRVLLIAALLFVFVHSMMPVSVSSQESAWFAARFINPVFRRLFHTELTDNLIRKFAHLIEYTAVGALLCGATAFSVPKTMICGLIAAFLDETLQILSGRGPMIEDVWLDLVGVAFGYAIFWLLFRGWRYTDQVDAKEPKP